MIVEANCNQLPLADNSIDLIWTDPPYPKEFLHCYEYLAREAMRVLKPGGFVLAMCGGGWLPKIYEFFEKSGLQYFYEFHHKSTGDAPTVWRHYEDRNAYPIVARSKPIIVYSKGPGRPRVGGVHNLFEATGVFSKMYHHWGQDVESARYYIDHFSAPGQLVLDPFIGGGTTAVACELIGRRWIGSDVDPVAIASSASRLSGAEIPYVMPLFEATA